jgi:ubiquitin-like-conjugating enzyme ATG3
MAMQYIRSTLNTVRDKYTPARHHSDFRESGQISPEEFLAAGDYLVYKFPSWSWSDASSPNQRVNYLPEGKQFLVTRAVPCRRRLGGRGVADSGEFPDVMIPDGEGGEEWLSAGVDEPRKESFEDRSGEVKSVDDSGRLGDVADDGDEIPDMDDDDDDDEAIIRDGNKDGQSDEGYIPSKFTPLPTEWPY